MYDWAITGICKQHIGEDVEFILAVIKDELGITMTAEDLKKHR